MLLNLTCVLIYSLTKCVFEDCFKDNCSGNFVIFVEKISMTKFTVKEATVCRVAIFFELIA